MFGKTISCRDIAGKTLMLKPIGKESVPRMTEWVNDPEVTKFLGSNFGQSQEQEAAWLESVANAADQCQWGIFWDGEHVGNAGLMRISPVDRNAVYGILIGEKSCWGKGIGTEVASAIAAYAFTTLNLTFLHADVFLPNEGSKRALEKAGFTECGRRPGAKFVDGEYLVNWSCYLARSEWKGA